MEAAFALRAGDHATVERLLPEVAPGCSLCAYQLEGDLALAVGDTARARRAFAAFDTARPSHEDYLFTWMVELARVLETSARLAEAQGDTAAAADYWARFIGQWEEADPELQPRVEAARRRLQALVGSGG